MVSNACNGVLGICIAQLFALRNVKVQHATSMLLLVNVFEMVANDSEHKS